MWEDEIKEVIGLIIVSSISIILFFALYYLDTNETLLAEKNTHEEVSSYEIEESTADIVYISVENNTGETILKIIFVILILGVFYMFIRGATT